MKTKRNFGVKKPLILNLKMTQYNMAKKFACGDVVAGCGWSTTAKNEEELFQKIAKHAKETHKMSEIPDEIIQKVKSKIVDI